MTGDGATILGTKFMNFLCHEYGKGAMLCSIKDCTPRLQEVGAIEATYIAHNMLEAIRFEMPTHRTYRYPCLPIVQSISFNFPDALVVTQ